MKIQVMLFAALADKAGDRTVSTEVPEHATVADVLKAVERDYPQLAPLLPACFVSVNQEYAMPDQPVREGDELAILPPVSGGQDPQVSEPPLFRVTEEPLQIEPVVRLVSHRNAGAVVTFVGTVREMTHGKRTVYLSYEAYEPMAISKMKQIAAEIDQRWPGTRVAIHHRVGDVDIEEIAVVIAVATPHRAEAFEASRYAIERLKQIVPIWKKERWEDGSEWQGHQQGPWNPLAPVDPS